LVSTYREKPRKNLDNYLYVSSDTLLKNDNDLNNDALISKFHYSTILVPLVLEETQVMPHAIKALLCIVVLVALATWLDSSLYGGFYTQAFNRMLSDIITHVS
jgi:hypothetical protein